MTKHCVTLYFPFVASELDPIFELGDALTEAIKSANAGEFDGNALGEDECILYMYGPDADILFRAIQPVLAAHSELVAGGVVELRRGPTGDDIQEVVIPSLTS